jgi:glyoxylase-like metal-dependent hydrolase (beta-lactamase superfamily II)
MAAITVEQLTLATIGAVPAWHPDHGSFEPFPVFGWLIRHPAGAILFDTGLGVGNARIDRWYRPASRPLTDLLAERQLATDEVSAVVLSHLHFDHCGQQNLLKAPVWIQRAEYEAAKEQNYTIAEWADIERARLRLLDGDAEPRPGIKIVATPGHTPGHQSLVIEADGGRVILAGQAGFRIEELMSGEPSPSNLHSPDLAGRARTSIETPRASGHARAELSHDVRPVFL